MSINVYGQEWLPEVKLIEKKDSTGLIHSGVRLVLHDSPQLPEDGERNTVTFWLPKSYKRRVELADTFEKIAHHVRTAQFETGAD